MVVYKGFVNVKGFVNAKRIANNTRFFNGNSVTVGVFQHLMELSISMIVCDSYMKMKMELKLTMIFV